MCCRGLTRYEAGRASGQAQAYLHQQNRHKYKGAKQVAEFDHGIGFTKKSHIRKIVQHQGQAAEDKGAEQYHPQASPKG